MLRTTGLVAPSPKAEGLRLSGNGSPAITCAGGVTIRKFIMNPYRSRGHEEEPCQKPRCD